MKKLITALFAICLLAMPAAAEEFAMHKAVTKFAIDAGASRSISRGVTPLGEQWQVIKYSFAPCDPSALKPINAAFDQDLDNKRVTLVVQQQAPFAYSIAYNNDDSPVLINSQTYGNIMLICGQPDNKEQSIVAIIWSTNGEPAMASGEIFIITRDPLFAAFHSDFNAPLPQMQSENVMRLQFYAKSYQKNNNFMHGGNIISAVALIVPQIIRDGDITEIEAAQNCLAEMIAVTPSPDFTGLQDWKRELETNSNTLLNLMQRLVAASGTGRVESTAGSFALNGNIDPELWDIGYYVYTSGDGLTVNTSDSQLIMANGRQFSYQADLDCVTIGRLQTLFKDGSVLNGWMEFPFVPGESANIDIHNGSYTIYGSPFYVQYAKAIANTLPGYLYLYAKEHSSEPGAVCAAFMSGKLSTDQLSELYSMLPTKYKNDHIGTFLRRFL